MSQSRMDASEDTFIQRSVNRSRLCASAVALALFISTGFAVTANAAATPSTPIPNVDVSDEVRSAWEGGISALRKEQPKQFKKHARALENHVLSPFLEYEKLKRQLHLLSHADIKAFRSRHPNMVVSELLSNRYIEQLAARRNWSVWLEETADMKLSTTRKCQRVQALLATGSAIDSLDYEIVSLWRAGKSQPDACDPVFKAWNKAGLLTNDRVIDRIGLAIGKGNTTLAKFLGNRYLDAKGQVWVSRWIAMRSKPARELDRLTWANSTSIFRNRIIEYGITRAARKDLDSAMEKSDHWMDKFALGDTERSAIAATIGLKAALDHHPSASTWLARVPADVEDARIRSWRIRAALREGRFERASEFMLGLNDAEKQKPKWRYWQARLLAQAGNTEQANTLYAELAATRNYYGFLAADRLGLPYAMNGAAPVTASAADLATLDELKVAAVLLNLGNKHMARRQWRFITSRMPGDQMRAAALVAHTWGWHDRAIITAGKSGHRDDLAVRFPVIYRDSVHANANRHSIEPAWVYGVIRQESAFMTDARSGVGALGLMQLMPATGKRMGKQLKIKMRGKRTLLEPMTNIKLGTAYLRTVLNKNQDHIVLATASYNAGPHRVKVWLPTAQSIDADIWVETIPYKETRNFVKNVLGFTTVYQHRLGLDPVTLGSRMPPVGPST